MIAKRPIRAIGAILTTLILLLILTTFLRSPSSSLYSTPPKPGTKNGEKLAYATYLAGTMAIPPPDDDDMYFVATRMLVYQTLHDPSTKSSSSLPIIVLVDPAVPESKIARLEKDGAIVIPVGYIKPEKDWLKPRNPRWRDMMVKLALWQLDQWDRILFLDSDVLLHREMDGVFEQPGAQVRESMRGGVTIIRSDEGEIPGEYVMGGVLDVRKRDHSYPPKKEEYLSQTTFNGGFFVCKPNLELFRHYTKILDLEGRFESDTMEMALLNYAHRDDGPMPWGRLGSEWHMGHPNWRDVQEGVASLHEKWWKTEELKLDKELGDWFWEVRWKMQGFYEGWDRAKGVENLKEDCDSVGQCWLG